MKIIADENIPLVDYYFGSNNEIVRKSGRAIDREDLVDADILLVRSVTNVNESLLKNTPVKFVGSATTGFDHLDISYLEKNHIRWAIAAGSNAQAVVEYVICVIAALQSKKILIQPNVSSALVILENQSKACHPERSEGSFECISDSVSKLRAGVIGVGRIGQRVVDALKRLNFEVIMHDPIRALEDPTFHSTELNEFRDLDFITLHVPLTHSGDYPTFHMIEKNFLQQQKSGCVLLNTSRGSVVDFADLKSFGSHLYWCLDVWENEPNIDLEVLKRAMIATPHIAGYSVQGKLRGTEMLYQAAVEQQIISSAEIKLTDFPKKTVVLDAQASWCEAVLAVYDPSQTTQLMKNALLHKTKSFDELRKHFQERNEFNYVDFDNATRQAMHR